MPGHPDPHIAVVVPTHDHGELLRWSVRSALGQDRPPAAVVLIGDGVDDLTRQVALDLAAADRRVEFLDLPKGPRLGEVHRHAWLSAVEGIDAVCYLSDDDLLLPHHLSRVAEALRDHDFVAPLATWIRATGEVACEPGDAARDEFRRLVATGPRTTFGLTGTSHTVAAYRRLPHGWRTTPAGRGTDHHMWAQWFEQPDLAAVTLTEPTVLHFPSPPRRDWSPERRRAEVEAWHERSLRPDFAVDHARATHRALAEVAVTHLVRERWWELTAEHASATAEDRGAALAEASVRIDSLYAEAGRWRDEATRWRDEAIMWRDEAVAQLAVREELTAELARRAEPEARADPDVALGPGAGASSPMRRLVGSVRRRLARRA